MIGVCQVCQSYPCTPRCPNWEEEKDTNIQTWCDMCGAPIYAWGVDICDECLENLALEAENEDVN